jgi:RNA polymerase sigma-70 factor (family 1)
VPQPDHSDIELFTRIAEGDESAFAAIFRTYTPVLEPLILGLTKSPSLVDEMIQETFVRLWISRDRLTSVENPRAWIFGITSHIAYTWLRRQIAERKVGAELQANASDRHDDIAEYMQLKELKTLIQDAVSRLTPQRQKIYRLSREQGMTIPEIAAELGLSPSTVKNTLVSALGFIREQLAAAGHVLPFMILWLTRR